MSEVTITESGTYHVPTGISSYTFRSNENLELTFLFEDSGAETSITGVVEVHDEAPSLSITLRHLAPQTKAEVLIKTLVRGEGAPICNGAIYIAPEASESESYLTHHSLLLTPESKSWSRPSLEICHDQVKCSHAATMRSLDDEELYYARTRGLSREEATNLLVAGFLA